MMLPIDLIRIVVYYMDNADIRNTMRDELAALKKAHGIVQTKRLCDCNCYSLSDIFVIEKGRILEFKTNHSPQIFRGWQEISTSENLAESFINKYAKYLCWDLVSANKKIKMSEAFILKTHDYICVERFLETHQLPESFIEHLICTYGIIDVDQPDIWTLNEFKLRDGIILSAIFEYQNPSDEFIEKYVGSLKYLYVRYMEDRKIYKGWEAFSFLKNDISPYILNKYGACLLWKKLIQYSQKWLTEDILDAAINKKYISFMDAVRCVKMSEQFMIRHMNECLADPGTDQITDQCDVIQHAIIIMILANQKMSEEFIESYMPPPWELYSQINICGYQKLSESFIKKHEQHIHFELISSYQILSEKLITDYKTRLNWNAISMYQTLSEKFIKDNHMNLNMKIVSQYQVLSEKFIIENASLLYMYNICRHQKISPNLLQKLNINIAKYSDDLNNNPGLFIGLLCDRYASQFGFAERLGAGAFSAKMLAPRSLRHS